MSLYSGKADVYDWCVGKTDEETLKEIQNTDFYIGSHIVPLRIDTIKDLVPYYPFLVSMGIGCEGRHVLRITTKSFVDIEEEDRLNWYLSDINKYIRRCKRKKECINVDYFSNEYGGKEKTKILKNVLNKKEPFEGVHLPMHEYYRQKLYEEMIRVGYSENDSRRWCFGWRTQEA